MSQLRPVILALVALFVSNQTFAQDYEIKLHRPSKVGDKYHLVSVGKLSEKTKVKVDGDVVENKEESLTITFEAEVEILAVDAKGREIKSAYTVEKCVVDADSVKSALVAPGQILVAEAKNGETSYTVKDEPLSEEASKVLELVDSIQSKDGPIDDDVLGTSKRQKVGDAWDIHKDIAISDLQKNHKIVVQPENISGQFKLVGVKKAGEMECLDIAGEMNMTDAVMEIPPGFKVEKSLLRATFGGLFPTNLTIGQRASVSTMTANITLKGNPQGKEVFIETLKEVSRTSNVDVSKNK